MAAEHPQGDPADLAALYAAGGMSIAESGQFEAHLPDCAECTAQLKRLDGVIVNLLGESETVESEPHTRDMLLRRIREARAVGAGPVDPQVWKRWDSGDPSAEVVVTHAAEKGWEQSGIEGIEFRKLFVDRERNQMSALVRMAAGTAYPGHLHNGPEECLVLEGDLRSGDRHLCRGDYQRMAPGTHHPEQSTENGCLLFIVSSLSDDIDQQ